MGWGGRERHKMTKDSKTKEKGRSSTRKWKELRKSAKRRVERLIHREEERESERKTGIEGQKARGVERK